MLENINFTLVSRVDSPQGQAKNKEQLHTSNFNFWSEPNPNGSLVSVHSVLTDESNNSYDLGLSEDKIKIPSIESILYFVENS